MSKTQGPIGADLLKIAAEVVIGMKGAADWTNSPEDVAKAIEVIASKLDDLREGK